MMTPFDVWAPMIRAPFSGDVTQEIVPRVFSPDIKGNAEIEQRIQQEVASFGTQLGKVLEALDLLAAQARVDLPEITALIDGIEGVKRDSEAALKADAEAALDRLRGVNPDIWRDVLATQSRRVEA